MRTLFTLQRVMFILVVVVLLAISGFVIWATRVPDIMPEAQTALLDNDAVDVTEATWIEFMPRNMVPSAGYILYPGGKVPAEAYAPIAHDIAAQGYFVAIVHAPLNFAVLDPTAAHPVMTAHPEITTWAVGGHSLGGVAASMYAKDHAGDIQGLVLMASIPFPGSDLQQRTDLSVVSIYGTRDGLMAPEDVQQSADELPATTVFVPVEGGNHGQFGWYGAQSGDNEASISRETQAAQIVAATVTLLRQIGDGATP